jgi:hypothetical protein
MPTRDPLQVTRKLVLVLEKLNIRYLVGGSLASSLHGIPRATQDVDVVAEITEKQVPALVERLATDFFIDEKQVMEAVSAKRSFNIIDKEDLFKVDIFVQRNDAISREEMNRRIRYAIADSGGDSLYLCSAEDTIINKLQWFEMGGNVSARQWDDAVNVIKVQMGRLDMAYLHRVARDLDIEGLLAKAIREAEESTGPSPDR